MDSLRPPSVRILQVSATRTDTIGGLETVVETLKNGLRHRGHTVTQVFLGDRFEQRRPDLWEIRLAAPATRRKIPTLRSVVQMASSLAKLCRLLWTVRPDVVHFNYATWETAYFVALRPLFRYRLVVTAHGSDLLSAHWPLARAILPYVLRRSNAVTAVSEALMTRALEIQSGHGPRPLLILNGVDMAYWSPASTTPPPAPRTIVCVGRLQHVKGHDVLLDAFVRVLKHVPDARLTLIGDGPERNALVERASRLGIRASVDFTGPLRPDAIREHLRTATVFALPSRSEGLPVALLEALATGTPAVASAVGGIPSVLANGGGYTVPPEDSDALANTLSTLLTDSALATQLAAAAHQHVQAYSLDHIVDAYERVLTGQGTVRPNRTSPAPARPPYPSPQRSLPSPARSPWPPPPLSTD